MSQTHAMLRQRNTAIGNEPPTEASPGLYDDEASAIAEGKRRWPTLCENVYSQRTLQAVTLTVIDRQQRVCWEREVPIHLERDPSLKDDKAWVLHLLRNYGPLTTPRIEAVAGLKPGTVDSCLRELNAQGHIRKCDKFPSVTFGPGNPADIWDVAEGGS